MDSARKIFQNLWGKWDIKRTVEPGGSFIGSAVFQTISDSEYLYTERGDMTLDNGENVEAYRSYIYKLEDDVIAVYFNDGESKGQLFHKINVNDSQTAETEHLCKDDLYKTVYEFDLPQKFTVKHTVKGPNKDYVSRSVMTRAD